MLCRGVLVKGGVYANNATVMAVIRLRRFACEAAGWQRET